MNEDVAWKKFQKRIQQPPVRRINWSWTRIAASIIVLIGIGVWIYFFTNDSVQQVSVASQQQVLIDTLPDGSQVTLNKSSSLSYPSKFTRATRDVVLKGEAFFSVEPNKEKPFIISANDVQVTVVGTKFNVKSTVDSTVVVVESGVVRVKHGDKIVELTAGEKIVIKPNDPALNKVQVDDKLYQYYRTKEFVCDETPLWKLVQVINEAYNSNVVIGNPALKDMTITTTFHNESLEQLLNVIGITFNIKIEKEGNTYILQ